ncbi:MAG: hypothetical protein K2K98_07510 [Muribaculaceae bacterium]|nr:hypothetical protein [Muribaculaceae bacterium]
MCRESEGFPAEPECRQSSSESMMISMAAAAIFSSVSIKVKVLGLEYCQLE